jgi:hypothetical protein
MGGPSAPETVRCLGLVFDRLRDAGLKLKPAKWCGGAVRVRVTVGLCCALMGDTILAHPQVDKEGWVVDTDASGYALETYFSQIQDGQERVIHYASKSITPEQWRYCTTKGELL